MHFVGHFGKAIAHLNDMSESSQTDASSPRPTGPARLTQSQTGKLQRAQERFIRELMNDLSALTRTAVTGVPLAMEEISGTDLQAALPHIACFGSVRIQDAASGGLLYATSSIVSSVVDAVLGGASPTAAERTTSFTALETMLLQAPMERMLSAFRAAWSEEISAVSVQIASITADVRAVRLDPHTTFLLMRVELQIGGREGEIRVAVPIRLARPEEPSSTEPSEHQQKSMLGLLQNAKLGFVVQVAGTTVRVGDLSALRPGDIFTFARSVEDPLTGMLNNQPVYSGHILVQGARRCFVIEEPNGSDQA